MWMQHESIQCFNVNSSWITIQATTLAIYHQHGGLNWLPQSPQVFWLQTFRDRGWPVWLHTHTHTQGEKWRLIALSSLGAWALFSRVRHPHITLYQCQTHCSSDPSLMNKTPKWLKFLEHSSCLAPIGPPERVCVCEVDCVMPHLVGPLL